MHLQNCVSGELMVFIQSIIQSINQPTNQPINQSIKSLFIDYSFDKNAEGLQRAGIQT